jgi:hypothetical protein
MMGLSWSEPNGHDIEIRERGKLYIENRTLIAGLQARRRKDNLGFLHSFLVDSCGYYGFTRRIF